MGRCFDRSDGCLGFHQGGDEEEISVLLCWPHHVAWLSWEGPVCAAQDSAFTPGPVSPLQLEGFLAFVSGSCCSAGRQPGVGTRGMHLEEDFSAFRAAQGAPSWQTSSSQEEANGALVQVWGFLRQTH